MKKRSGVACGVSQKAMLRDGDGKILIIRRSATSPIYPLFWDLPGGILDIGEESKEAMRREIKEETGLEATNVELLDAGSWFSDPKRFWVTLLYVAEYLPGQVALSYEHDEYRWAPPEQFLEMKSHIAVKNILLEGGLKRMKGIR